MRNFDLEVFDERRCKLGEGPSSRGSSNSLITWVDILGRKVLGRDLQTGSISKFETTQDVGFIVPAKGSSYVYGSGKTLVKRSEDGVDSSLFDCAPSDFVPSQTSVRWNDAKVSPDSFLFAGTMADAGTADAGKLFRIDSDFRTKVILPKVSISNGLDWSLNGEYFFYIDTLTFELARFDYADGEIQNRQAIVRFEESGGLPDGMCADAEDGLWVAFFAGSRVARYSPTGQLTEVLDLPVKNPTSCCFSGEDLRHMIITTAQLTDEDSKFSGMTFICSPGVQGKATTEI